VLGIGIISICYPIFFKKRIYHMLLPVGRRHDIVKTMRDFLMEDEFLLIFTAFLQHMDEVKDTNKYTETLDYWKNLMVLKYHSGGDIMALKNG